jgi:hypothetical protein
LTPVDSPRPWGIRCEKSLIGVPALCADESPYLFSGGKNPLINIGKTPSSAFSVRGSVRDCAEQVWTFGAVEFGVNEVAAEMF